MDIFQSIVLGIVEGLTEFLPVSSTGHLIATSSLMGIQKEEFTKLFEIFIQLGSILAVVVVYWKKFFNFKQPAFYIKLAAAVVPALVAGFLLADKIDQLLESPTTVAVMLIIGGFIFLFIDGLFLSPKVYEEEKVTLPKAILIGCWQCLALVPGVSRSAASIIGGMQQKLTRYTAAEFSFFLAVPTMLAATGYKLLKAWKHDPHLITDHIPALAVGNLVAFIVAILAIRFFIKFVQHNGFKLFGIYRIVAGIVLLILIFTGVITK